jgi:hypothetical protein
MVFGCLNLVVAFFLTLRSSELSHHQLIGDWLIGFLSLALALTLAFEKHLVDFLAVISLPLLVFLLDDSHSFFPTASTTLRNPIVVAEVADHEV